MKSISILGSTGSIGIQTLDIIKNNPTMFKVDALSTKKNIKLLEKQIDEFKPKFVSVLDEELADELQARISIKVHSGPEGLIKLSKLGDSETIVNALVGSAGVLPTYESIQSGKNIALANKETLVVAGEIIMDAAKKNNVTIMPIDSEHSAIFQCLQAGKLDEVQKITLTCSGGPFRDYNHEQLMKVTVKDALKHPTWNMGPKITIDSSTLMNKGFEVIEAHFLYNTPYEKIEVLIHQQSIIHSMVTFKDNSTIAQLSYPDMRIPIQYALTYPDRFQLNTKKLDLFEIKELTFGKPDFKLFPCLKYAYEAGKIGGTMPCVLNAANEIAVKAFLESKIKFLDIPSMIKKAMEEHQILKNPTIDEIQELDKSIKERVIKLIYNF